MLDHLDKKEAGQFISEAFRVLKPKGILRITVPDLDDQIMLYIKNRDADRFMRYTMLGREDTNSGRARLKHLLIGDRAHLWMYNQQSLLDLLTASGFVAVKTVADGETGIERVGGLNLSWRSEGSITIEGVKPTSPPILDSHKG